MAFKQEDIEPVNVSQRLTSFLAVISCLINNTVFHCSVPVVSLLQHSTQQQQKLIEQGVFEPIRSLKGCVQENKLSREQYLVRIRLLLLIQRKQAESPRTNRH